jgi:Xaa-Pro aminopeptidase
MAAIGSFSRVSRLASTLRDTGVDAFFAWSPITMKYLAGFGESAHERFLVFAIRADGETEMICPALSENQVRRSGIENIHSWTDNQDPLALFADLAQRWNLKSGILAVDDDMSARQLLQMQSVLPAALFKAGQPVVSTLMRKKDAQELATMRKAAKIADDAYPAGLAALKAGVKETVISDALANEMKRLGGTPSFSIIGAGANGAEPHHLTDQTVVKSGDVIVMDFGCAVDGYQSDITRCACCGKAEDEAKKVYEIVLTAHMASRAKIKPGVEAQEIDRAGREVIKKAGYGEFFVHRTGHGIGMRGHEDPYIVEGNDTPLEVGDCFSIEPGIYLPGRFGIRIENIVNVTADGHESQNAEPADSLVEIG